MGFKAGLTFRDLRHAVINSRRLEGHDYFRIMPAAGHKSMSVLKRDNTVGKGECKALGENLAGGRLCGHP